MGRGSSQGRTDAQQTFDTASTAVADQTPVVAAGNAALAPANAAVSSSIAATPLNYTPEQQAAITGNSADAINASFGAGGQQINNAAAKTRNQAGVFSNLSDMATKRAQATGTNARQITEDIANTGYQRQVANTGQLSQQSQNLAQQYGVNANLLTGLYGATNNANSAYNGAISKFGVGPIQLS